MINGKQRSYLKSLAHNIDPILIIGKNGITETVLKQVDEALEARELVKIKLLDTSFLNANDVANAMAEELRAEFVQSIGGKFVLYRESKEPKINIPK